MMIEFKGKNVLITGAAMGIGRSLSRHFAKDGANLALADLPQEKDRLESWTNELQAAYGINTWTFYGDLTEPHGPEKLYEDVIKTVGGIHTLVNNAGIGSYVLFREMPPEMLERMILLNCMAYAKLTRLFLPAMVEKDEGGVLNVTSAAAFQPVPTMSLYAGTKAFTQSITESIRLELPRKSKVVISTLNPPFTRTHLVEHGGFPPDYLPKILCYLNVDEVTESGYRAFKKGKIRFVPGMRNKLLHLGIVKYLPYKVVSFLLWLLVHNLSDFLPGSLVKSIVKWRS